jgi:BMFP domain-containing protein YqiC
MLPNPSAPGPVRSADVLNELIRALWQRAGGSLDVVQRREYEQLVVEWAAAVRIEEAGIAEAA